MEFRLFTIRDYKIIVIMKFNFLRKKLVLGIDIKVTWQLRIGDSVQDVISEQDGDFL